MFSKRKRKYYTINEIHTYISNLESKSKRLPEIIGFRSTDTCKNFKDLISLCNSLSIVFVQYDLIEDCMIMLKTATTADSNLCKYGTVLDRLWQNRILTFNNLAFMYHKVNQPGDSLKFLYEAHGLAQNIKESGGVTSYDLSIASNMLTFVVLWKLRRYEQGSVYVDLSGDILSEISSGKKQTRFNENATQNIFGLLAVFMAGLALKLEGSFKKAITILDDSLQQIDNRDLPVRVIIKDLIRELYKKKNTNSSILQASGSEISIDNVNSDDYLPHIPDEALHNQVKTNYDWLITKDLETLMFITCFVPFISPATPLIKVSELEKSRENYQPEYSEAAYPIYEASEIDETIDLPYLPSNKPQKSVPSRQSYIRKTSSNDRSPPRSQAWWEKKTETRYQSEPRGSSYSNRDNFPRMITPYNVNQPSQVSKPHAMMPKGKISQLAKGIYNQNFSHMPSIPSVPNPNPSSSKHPIRDSRLSSKPGGVPRHIMLEFNPISGGNMPVELIPMPPSKSKLKPVIFDPFYQDICD